MDVQSLSAIKKAKAALEAKLEALGLSVGTKVDNLSRDLSGALNAVGERLTIIRDDVGNVGTSVDRVASGLGSRLDTVGTALGSKIDMVYSRNKPKNVIVKTLDMRYKGTKIDIKGSGKLYFFGGDNSVMYNLSSGPTTTASVIVNGELKHYVSIGSGTTGSGALVYGIDYDIVTDSSLYEHILITSLGTTELADVSCVVLADKDTPLNRFTNKLRISGEPLSFNNLKITTPSNSDETALTAVIAYSLDE